MPRPLPEVRYETASGGSWRFAGGSSLYSIGAFGWERTADGRAVRSEAREIKGQLAFAAGTSREEADRLLALACADMDAGTPGALSVGGWRMRCYLIKIEPSVLTGSNALFDVTLHAPDPVWERETVTQLLPGSGTEVSAETLDYPHGHPHDYGAGTSAGAVLRVPGPLPCGLHVRFYGYAVSPYVKVGGNTYQVNVTVPDGAYLEVDPARKASMAGDSVRLVGRYGDVQNVFSKRLRGAEGSGTYIFQPVEPGEQTVTWPQDIGVDLGIVERRGSLPWTSF